MDVKETRAAFMFSSVSLPVFYWFFTSKQFVLLGVFFICGVSVSLLLFYDCEERHSSSDGLSFSLFWVSESRLMAGTTADPPELTQRSIIYRFKDVSVSLLLHAGLMTSLDDEEGTAGEVITI